MGHKLVLEFYIIIIIVMVEVALLLKSSLINNNRVLRTEWNGGTELKAKTSRFYFRIISNSIDKETIILQERIMIYACILQYLSSCTLKNNLNRQYSIMLFVSLIWNMFKRIVLVSGWYMTNIWFCAMLLISFYGNPKLILIFFWRL